VAGEGRVCPVGWVVDGDDILVGEEKDWLQVGERAREGIEEGVSVYVV